MMKNLLLSEGDIVCVRNVSLPPGTFAKFEPQSVDFLDISDPRAVYAQGDERWCFWPQNIVGCEREEVRGGIGPLNSVATT